MSSYKELRNNITSGLSDIDTGRTGKDALFNVNQVLNRFNENNDINNENMDKNREKDLDEIIAEIETELTNDESIEETTSTGSAGAFEGTFNLTVKNL